LSKNVRLWLLFKAVCKHLKLNAVCYYHSIGAIYRENYFEAIGWLALPTLRVCIGALETYFSHRRKKSIDDKRKL
jgi:hypothetical protein